MAKNKLSKFFRPSIALFFILIFFFFCSFFNSLMSVYEWGMLSFHLVYLFTFVYVAMLTNDINKRSLLIKEKNIYKPLLEILATSISIYEEKKRVDENVVYHLFKAKANSFFVPGELKRNIASLANQSLKINEIHNKMYQQNVLINKEELDAISDFDDKHKIIIEEIERDIAKLNNN